MSYKVKWTNEALAGLTAIWLRVTDRRAVNEAQERIDERLARNPAGEGFHRAEGLHAIDEPPLRALCELFDARRKVTVVAVHQLV